MDKKSVTPLASSISTRLSKINGASHQGGSTNIGSFRKVAIYMVTRIGFKLEEIQAATKEMIEKDHNAAHFGIYRGFISTFKKEFKYARQFKAG